MHGKGCMKYAELVELYEKLEATTKRLEKTYYISLLLKKTPTEDLEHITLLLQGKIYPDYDQRKIGVASKIVLRAMGVASGICSTDIEKEWKKTGDLGITAEHLMARKK